MKRKTLIALLAAEICVLILLIALAVVLCLGFPGAGSVPVPDRPGDPSVQASEPAGTAPETEAFVTVPPVPETTVPETAAPETTAPETEPEQIRYHLTFAGDCTLGTIHTYYGAASCFPAVVGEDYAYPLSNVSSWFAKDDFTLVNLEGPLTEGGTPADKTFPFRGDPKLVQVLTEGSVEAVSIANNHSMDFGQAGYDSTRNTLKNAGIAFGGDGDSILVETQRGLKIGVFFVAFNVDTDYMARSIAQLREQGAEIVIASFHWGTEGSYRHTYGQELYAHSAIDAGADVVFGHHPHVLQEIETYENGLIFYSLGNFSFGGNENPRDFDTALISLEVIREPDGSVSLGDYTAVPCSISSVSHINNYQPTPAETDSERYQRVMDKLAGTFSGEDLSVSVPEGD